MTMTKSLCIPVALLISFVLAMTMITRANGQDLTPLLTNRDLVQYEIGCVLRRNKCDFIGKQIRAMLPEALNNNCARCNGDQSKNANALMGFMRDNYPSEWRQIQQMYGRGGRRY